MKTVLVTGGTGFVGYWMRCTQPPDLECTYLSRDRYEFGPWRSVYHIWDYIAHLAPINPAAALAHLTWQRAGRLLYCSSGAVYHDNPTEYGLNKRRWEADCLASGLDVVIARLFSFYGAHLDQDKALVKFTNAAKAGEPLVIWGDGNTVRSYMSGAEMGRWLWAILLRGKSGEAYDVGSDTPVTMLQLARWIIKAYRSTSSIVIENRPDRVPVYLPRDTAKTKALL